MSDFDFDDDDFGDAQGDSGALRDLRKATHHKVSYITLHSRVKKAMEDGTVVKSGLKAPTKVRRGRRELVFSLVNTPVVTEPVTAEVATPSSTNW